MKEQDISNRPIRGLKPRGNFEFRDGEYVFIVTRFVNFKLVKRYNQEDYSYFLYIFKQEHKVVDEIKMKTKIKNILCFQHVYQNYNNLAKNMLLVIKEYILEKETLFDFLQNMVELDPELIRLQ